MMKFSLFRWPTLALSFVCAMLSPWAASAEQPTITFRYQHHLFYLDPDLFETWNTADDVWTLDGVEVQLPEEYLAQDGEEEVALPEGLEREERYHWDTEAIAQTIEERIGERYFNREARDTTISRDEDGTIVFDGFGMKGRRVDAQKTAELVVAAIELGVPDVTMVVEEWQPTITVLDSDLRANGVQEIVAVGESDFAGSPANRRHNIKVGFEKFDGSIIPAGEEFSFNAILGPVNAAAGFLRELIIYADRTEPDYGGGLCQNGSTVFRGAWEYGFPITQRRNHSYQVQYYSPPGTDCTVYPPHTDCKFLNDSPADLLIQSYTDGDKAYFVFYGTPDDREAEIIGPFLWGSTSVGAKKVEYTTELAPGTQKVLQKPVPGLSAAWFRIVTDTSGDESIEPFYSKYQSRGWYIQEGVESVPGEELEPPAHLLNDSGVSESSDTIDAQ